MAEDIAARQRFGQALRKNARTCGVALARDDANRSKIMEFAASIQASSAGLCIVHCVLVLCIAYCDFKNESGHDALNSHRRDERFSKIGVRVFPRAPVDSCK